MKLVTLRNTYKTMLNLIDKKLNTITMYRLVLYYLFGLLIVAVVLGYFGVIPYSPIALVISTTYITFFCYLTNLVFSKIFGAPTNIESLYITALILVFIITPPNSFTDSSFFILAGWAAIWSMATKYMFAINKKHLFNPAAIAVFLTSLFLGLSASWWVGTLAMAPFVLIGGLLLTRKIIRFDLVLSFFATALVSIVLSRLITSTGVNIITIIEKTITSSSLLFFAFVMLTEPLTTPPTKKLRVMYGGIVGILFSPAIHISSLYFTPEIALLVGNVFSYIVSPKEKLMLRLKERVSVATDTYDFVFQTNQSFSFEPGQYLEWTMPHEIPDDRGNRRYFTIASSPTEKDIRMGVKFYPSSSSYKKTLGSMNLGETIVASQRAGDFTLPKNKKQKLVLIAGGIGITPFRSMMKYMVDKQDMRPVTLIYSNKTLSDIAYTNIIDQAVSLGMKAVYTLTDTDKLPPVWNGQKGFINEDMIRTEVPDFTERIFYISGPHAMVTATEETLRKMGIKQSQIKIDFFPGFV